MNKEREKIRKEIFDKPKDVAQGQSSTPSDIEDNPEINSELLKRFPPERLKKIMAKEARRYQLALKKKWSRWFESVSK